MIFFNKILKSQKELKKMHFPMIKSQDNRSVNNGSHDLTACVSMLLLLSSALAKDGIACRANTRCCTSMPNFRNVKVKVSLRHYGNMRDNGDESPNNNFTFEFSLLLLSLLLLLPCEHDAHSIDFLW